MRPHVRRRARARAARVGRRRRGDDRSGVACSSTIRRSRSSKRTRCSRRRSPSRPICRCGRSSSAAAAARTSARSRRWPRDTSGSASSGSTRTATSTRRRRRRPGTSGGCRCGCSSTAVRSSPQTSRSSAHGTSTRRRSSSSPPPGSTTPSTLVLDRVDAVYVALDCDVFEPSELTVFMPEPGGPTLIEIERVLAGLRERGTVVGAGFTGLAPDPANVEKLERLCAALGFCERNSVRREDRSKLGLWPRSTSRSRPTTSRRPRRSTRTPARAATPTTGTTSSRSRSGSADSAGTTSRCARERGSRRSWTRARSRRNPRISTRRIRSASSTCARTRSGSPRPSCRRGSRTRS